MSHRFLRDAVKVSLIIIMSLGDLCALHPSMRAEEKRQGSDSGLRYEVEGVFSGKLVHTIQVDNPSLEVIRSGILFVPLVRNETAHHYAVVSSIAASEGHLRMFDDAFGNSYACWDNLTIEAVESYTVTIEYYVLSFGIRYLIDPRSVPAYDQDTQLYGAYTQPEELVQSDAPEIVSKATSLTGTTTDAHEKVLSIYNFVVSRVHYARQDHEQGALWALENGTGDCSEYSYLFVALCRAAGIPARIKTGFGFRSSHEKTNDGHMWAEYYLDNYGWVPVDPTWKLFDKIDEKHLNSMESMPEIIPYANYFFNYTEGPDQSRIRHWQEIALSTTSTTPCDPKLVETATKAVQTISRARLAVSIYKLLGMQIILAPQAREADEALLLSQIDMQNALEALKEQSDTVHFFMLEAKKKGDEASQKAWMLVGYGFAIFIVVLVAILVACFLYIRRLQPKTGRQVVKNESAPRPVQVS